jgi:uncharacterized protein
MGTDVTKGEVRQLLVGTGVWKMSRLPEADLKRGEREEVGCLITEVVVPGFAWEDHEYLTRSGFEELFEGHPEGKRWIEELGEFVKKT